MAFFNTPIATLLVISLSVALSAALVAPPPMISMEEQAEDIRFLKAELTVAAAKVDQFLVNVMPKLLNDPTNAARNQPLRTCQHVYESALDSLGKGLASVLAGDLGEASVHANGFSTDITTCQDCFDEGLPLKELQDFDGWAMGVVQDFLARTIKYTSLYH